MIAAGGGHPTYGKTEVNWFNKFTGQPPRVYASFKGFCKVPKKTIAKTG
jgi:hypothetical protein